MASEVANVLTNDDIDRCEPVSLDFDLKDRNQFLTTCLEEQKQLVNDLHIEISCCVSIVYIISTLYVYIPVNTIYNCYNSRKVTHYITWLYDFLCDYYIIILHNCC